MKVSLPLNDGAVLTLEPLAGHVVLQLELHGLRPYTVAMPTSAAAVLIDLVGLVACQAEEQTFELDLNVALCELRARQQPRDLASTDTTPADLEIPAFLRPLGADHA